MSFKRLAIIGAALPALTVGSLLLAGCGEKEDATANPSGGTYYTGPMKSKGGPPSGGAPVGGAPTGGAPAGQAAPP
jgi:hypothetical protein